MDIWRTENKMKENNKFQVTYLKKFNFLCTKEVCAHVHTYNA